MLLTGFLKRKKQLMFPSFAFNLKMTCTSETSWLCEMKISVAEWRVAYLLISMCLYLSKQQRSMVPLQNQPALLGTRGGVRRLTLPLWSPEFPREFMRGRVIGTRGCTEGMRGLAAMGVRMGMADIVDMDDRPTDRFGIEPIPIKSKHRWK